MNRRPSRWLAAGALALLVAPALAQTPPKPSEAERQKSLELKRNELKDNRKREQEIQKDLASIAAERVQITEKSKLTAAKVQQTESELSAAELTAYFTDLRQKMEASGRVPLG